MTTIPIAVECQFAENGVVQVKRVKLQDKWHSVEQGRQWVDENGRHALIMLPNNQVREIILNPQTLLWQMKLTQQNQHVV